MTTESTRKVSRMLGLDLHAWETLMLAAFVLAFTTTLVVVILTRRENASIKQEYDTYKVTVEGRVADAKSEGIKAGEAVGNAVVRAAGLEKEAAKLEKEAEEAKLETVRLKAQVAWRRISPEQRKVIIDDLSGKNLSIHFDYSQSDPEAAQFAEDLFTTIKAAGITAYQHPLVSPPAPPGVVIFGTEDDAACQALKSALDRANIPFKMSPRNGPARLSIGSKAAPF